MYTLSIFLFCLTIITLLVGKLVFPFEGVRRMVIIVSGILPTTTITTTTTSTPMGLDDITFTQGNVRIQLDGIGDFSSKAHYFV